MKEAILLASCLMLFSCLVCSLTLKRGETYSSEISVDFQRTTLRYIPEDRTSTETSNPVNSASVLYMKHVPTSDLI
jgi:hypothetical protein